MVHKLRREKLNNFHSQRMLMPLAAILKKKYNYTINSYFEFSWKYINCMIDGGTFEKQDGC